MLDNIALFIKLCEAKSLKACSEKINIHSSTISKRISELEEELGHKLVTRTAQKFELSAYGRYLYENCKHIPLFVNKIINVYQNNTISQKVSGTINVAIGTLIYERLISPHIGKFLSRHPNIKLNLNLYPFIRSWLDPQLDLVLSVDYIRDENLENRFLRHEYVRLYCSQEYVTRNGVPETINELTSHKIIGLVGSDFKPLDYVRFKHRNTNEEYLLDLTNNQFNMSQYYHSLQVGLRGDFLFGAYDALIHEELRSGLIIPVLPDWYACEMDFYVVTKKKLSQETQLFIDFIHECMQERC